VTDTPASKKKSSIYAYNSLTTNMTWQVAWRLQDGAQNSVTSILTVIKRRGMPIA